MNTRTNKQHTVTHLTTALTSACQAGVTYDEALAALRKSYVSADLSPSVLEALHHPTIKANVQTIEGLEADALTKLWSWPSHSASHCDLNNTKRRNSHTVYVRDQTRREFAREMIETRVFLSATQHNLGADMIEFTSFDIDDCIYVTLVQQKIGKASIHAGASAANANRSMRFIADKLDLAGDLVAACLEEEFDMSVAVSYRLDTVSPVNAPARAHAARKDVEIYDASYLWKNVWPESVKEALISIHGKDKAKGFGNVL